jgi:hypothetical protein
MLSFMQSRAAMNRQIVALAASLLFVCATAWGASPVERGFIRKGMKEAEVVQRIGPPDREIFLRNVRGEPEEKEWSYFPATGDSQTLAIITIKAGVVELVERKISR